MVYSPFPPYEILQTSVISFEEMQLMRRFSRHWDLVANSGNFVSSAPLIWKETPSAFHAFMQFSHWLHLRAGRTHGIALNALGEFLFEYLTATRAMDKTLVAQAILRDYDRAGRSDFPAFQDRTSQ